MRGLMQDYPLTLQHLLWRMERLFARKEIVSKTEQGVHRYTYGDLIQRVNRLAAALRRLGVGEGDRVATLAWNDHRHLELYYAVPCMGAVLHTLNLRLFPDQLEFTIRDAEDSVVVVDRTLVPLLARVADRLPSLRTIVVIDGEGPLPDHSLGEVHDYERLLAAEEPRFSWPRLDENVAAAMCYTSGTTGNPKGVVYSHRSQFLHAMCVLQADSMGLSERDAVLPLVPMFHANCWGIPYAAGMAGSKVIFPGRFLGDAQVVVDLAEQEGATVMAGVPTIWINVLQILERTGRRLPRVRSVLCGGSAIPRGLMEGMDRVGLRMIHAWGMTETSPVGSFAQVRSWTPPERELEVRLKQGAAAPGVEIRIADLATGEELPWDGVTFGEIQCRGPWIAAAYNRNADPDRFTEDGWLRTGDVATIDPDGYLAIVDRTKDVIKSGGEWISSVELEGAIMAHPKVLEAAVIGLQHPTWQERPVAYVVPKPEFKGQVTAQEIQDFLVDRVAKWWLPDEIRFIDELPKTSTMKFDKKALRATAEPLAAARSTS
ncbi:MAG TPA: long-chain fatty acid--CoA ligase [Candidatus Dormibacteraeota bacterium]|jgi:fatty-acyl-CoA synthase|nr:long-chain fatty acid--CoA ligase [Candidatus Dormibacteraeota bacterium]